MVLLFLAFLTFLTYNFASFKLLEKNPTLNSKAAPPKKNRTYNQSVGTNWFPYFAKIITSSNGVCGGFLISENYVITAAHCVYSEWKGGGILKVYIGVNDYSGEYYGQFAGVVEHSISNQNIFVPDGYRPSASFADKYKDLYRDTYDIAVLRLKIGAYGVPTLSFPPAFASSNKYPEYKYMGEKATVVGTGVLQLGSATMANIPIRDYLLRPKSSILLKPDENSTVEIIAHGDSGGPAILYYNNHQYAIGVIRASKPSWESSYLSSITYYSDWITKVSQVPPESGSANRKIGDTSDFPPQVPICTTIHSFDVCNTFSDICEWGNEKEGACKSRKL